MAIQTYTVNANQDTSGSSQGYHTLSRLFCGRSASGTFHAFIGFQDSLVEAFLDLGGVQSTGQITKAELYMYARHTQNVSNPQITARRITESWDAPEVSGSNSPDTTDTDQFTLLQNPYDGTPNKLSKFDITEIVKGWVNDTNPVYGIKLSPVNANSLGAFHSLESNETDYRPKLVITYDDTPVAPVDDGIRTIEFDVIKDNYYGRYFNTPEQQGNHGSSQFLRFGSLFDHGASDHWGQIQCADISGVLDLENVESIDQIIKGEFILMTPPEPDFVPVNIHGGQFDENNFLIRTIREEWDENAVSFTNPAILQNGDAYLSIIENGSNNPFSEAGKQTALIVSDRTLRAWITGSPPVENNGVEINPNFVGVGQFASREYPIASYRPKFRITYKVPAQTTITKPANYKVRTTPKQTGVLGGGSGEIIEPSDGGTDGGINPDPNGGLAGLGVSQDTFIGNIFDQTGNQDAPTMTIGGSGDATYEAYIQFSQEDLQDFFNLRGVTDTDQIDSAELLLTSQSSGVSDPQINIHRVTESWSDDTISNKNKPTVNTNPELRSANNPFSNGGKVSRFDITSAVIGWLDNDFDNHGIRLNATHFNNTNGKFYSSEFTQPDILDDVGETLRPRLVITYSVAKILKDANYKVRTDSTITKQAKYVLFAKDRIQKSANYKVKTKHPITKQAEYKVATPQTIQKSATYSVLYRGDIETNQDDYERLNKK